MAALPSRRLGTTDIAVRPLLLGFLARVRPDARQRAVRSVRAAVQRGVTPFDVGVYGTPDTRRVCTDVLFGAAIRASRLRRDDYLVSVKLWTEDWDPWGSARLWTTPCSAPDSAGPVISGPHRRSSPSRSRSGTRPNASTLVGASRAEHVIENLGGVDVLERRGGDEIRALVEPFCFDRDVVDPEGI